MRTGMQHVLLQVLLPLVVHMLSLSCQLAASDVLFWVENKDSASNLPS